MKISVSSYSYSQYLRDGRLTQLDVVKAAAEAGFEGIEFTEIRPREGAAYEERLDFAEKIRREAEKYGISIVAYDVGASLYHESAEECTAEVERVCREIDIASLLGAPLVRHDVCYSVRHGGRVRSFDAMLPVIAHSARQITEYALGKGIRTCSENHGYVAQDSDRVERLLSAVDHENYGLLVDIGNFACADEDSASAVSRLAPYAFHVHAKDFKITPFGEYTEAQGIISRGCNLLCGCVIGEGDIPVARCLAILKRAGYNGFVTVEYEGSEDCLSGIARGKANLEKYT